MKVFILGPVVNLSKPVEPTDFASRAKYETKTSLVVKFDERFPVTSEMPIKPKNLNENPDIAAKGQFLSELKVNDWAMIRIAYERAVAHDEIKRIDTRRDRNRKIAEDDANRGIMSEIGDQKFRIFMEWIKRFQMEKMFENLGLKSLDDFKQRHFSPQIVTLKTR